MISNNEQFSRYVTSTAFSLSLSGQMIAALDHLATCRREGRWILGVPPGWTTGCAALTRRGLAYHTVDPERPQYTGPIHLTEPGRLVHQLCILAGLIVVPNNDEAVA